MPGSAGLASQPVTSKTDNSSRKVMYFILGKLTENYLNDISQSLYRKPEREKIVWRRPEPNVFFMAVCPILA
jgi:hypothetical protein